MEVDEFLEHFGVRGMSWGSRKKETSPSINNLSNNQLRQVIDREYLNTEYANLPSSQAAAESARIHARNKKIIIGVGVAATIAAGAIFAKKFAGAQKTNKLNAQAKKRGEMLAHMILDHQRKVQMQDLSTVRTKRLDAGLKQFQKNQATSTWLEKARRKASDESVTQTLNQFKKDSQTRTWLAKQRTKANPDVHQ